jgi:hypothetical protein
MRLSFALALLTALSAAAQSDDAQRALDLFELTRPTEDDLVMYRMDWEPALPRALDRAQAEKKPVCLVIIHAKYGDLYSGHC